MATNQQKYGKKSNSQNCILQKMMEMKLIYFGRKGFSITLS